MIYRKDANFPYPVLANTSDSYEENYFDLDVNVSDNVDYYFFDFSYEIDSEFIRQLIAEGKAQIILIIQTKDNKFYKLTPGQKQVKIKKSRLSLNNQTSIQLHIQALETINFSHNEDLNDFYMQFKDELSVEKFSLLGYSNVVQFNGNIKKPFELFEKKLDENLTSDIKLELGQETIIIHYKNRDSQFNDLRKSNALNNVYIYAGLSKALQAFIMNNGEEGDVDLEDMEEPEGALDLKLFNLMKKKQVTELNMENIDEVIYTISDRVIERFTSAVRGLEADGS
ncbi:hypothetical protein [Pseudogracilibacillus sp. SO30301A]|uniref:hypothetical protein n=1 Tax=Pseudogracilibacillus sp. SO30301A TaxID=3098291 RepID=UPI00300E08E4